MDVWAFGCTLHRLAFLRPYAEGDPLPETPAYSRPPPPPITPALVPNPLVALYVLGLLSPVAPVWILFFSSIFE